jgi:serine/threonine-protein kinase
MTGGALPSLVGGALLDERYKLKARLGEGAFGEVWKALDTRFGDHPVAVKLLRPELLTDEVILGRFENEARALSLLRHPNVVTVLDRGEWQGQRFMVLELVEGDTLSDWLGAFVDEKSLPPLADVREILDQICAGVGAAHRIREPGAIVHRDLKPANIVLHRDPGAEHLVKVLDFGIARLGARSGTLTGWRIGTPHYMAPEQGLGRASAICPATDVFALAVILLELVTGQATVGDEDPWWAWVLRHEGQTRARLDQLRDDVPPPVWEVVERALRYDVQARPADADQLRAELRGAWGGRAHSATPSSSPIPCPRGPSRSGRTWASMSSGPPNPVWPWQIRSRPTPPAPRPSQRLRRRCSAGPPLGFGPSPASFCR